MKQLLILLLICTALSSCRSIQRSLSQADSTAVRSEQSAEKWNREIIREYQPYPVRLDSPIYHPPQIHVLETKVPGQPVLIREVIRDQGERSQAKQEEKTVATVERAVEKDYSTLIQIALALFALFLLLLGVGFLIVVWALLIRKR
ncbi:hypothetical protein GCM10027275_24820 [Rhabdobacter roseus]|uniref:Uncharacterized protein YceK n=1 Tax=Rhabdobacter roseus TaxID=1655419 RepID=A0A840TS80_9BACT|nr:hypothetical protein [Rhabdobacter roseus]MBB5284422.1 uncharacterized protein YceK [Rhabdobacter roseus]